jgi:sigma-E factor negative regulatory protein RseB
MLKEPFWHIRPSLFAINFALFGCCFFGLNLGLGSISPAWAAAPPQEKSEMRPAEKTADEWLQRMQSATSRRSYVGTFVVSSSGGLYSSRIWHSCDGAQQVERVESLTGIPRTTYRRNDDVVTFQPLTRVARIEKREASGLFPSLKPVDGVSVAENYSVKAIAQDRTAGFDADVVQFVPKDKLRFGYLIWSERKTGLVIKAQTLNLEGQVIEQSAFSELILDAAVKSDRLVQLMNHTEGYRVEKPEVLKTSAAAEGWQLKSGVAGFKPVSCFKRLPENKAVGDGTLQWIFSDGLASVSLFVETFDKQRHLQESLRAMGATQTLTKHLQDGSGDWWLTVMGEVPTQTLLGFAQNLERKK